jgi:hypothetical protein
VAKLWQTYTLRTDIAAVFRSLKSELGLRPVYHRISPHVEAHLFISDLAPHLAHTVRLQLKAQGDYLSWERLPAQITGQDQVTVVLYHDDGKIFHLRLIAFEVPPVSDLPEALGLPSLPGNTTKTLIDPTADVSQIYCPSLTILIYNQLIKWESIVMGDNDRLDKRTAASRTSSALTLIHHNSVPRGTNSNRGTSTGCEAAPPSDKGIFTSQSGMHSVPQGM